MRLEQLQAFLAIAQTRSFQIAAQQCHLTQSTISRQIQALEAAVGVELFHRGGQVSLTVAGECLLPRARRICQEWASATEELHSLMTGKQTELCIAVISSVCCYHLPWVFEQFNQAYPSVQLRITALGSDRALKVLRDGLVDLAVIMHNRFLTSQSPLVVLPLFQDDIYVLMATGHPLAAQPHIAWADLANHPQAVFKDGYGMRRVVEEQFAQRQMTLPIAVELNTLDAFRAVVRQGRWLALLPQSALTDISRDPQLTVRPLETPGLTREVVCVTTPDRLLIPPIQHFCNLLQEVTVTLPIPDVVVQPLPKVIAAGCHGIIETSFLGPE